MKLKCFFFRWWPFIAGFFLIILFATLLDAQEKPKFTDKIDYAHIHSIQHDAPALSKEGQLFHVECHIFVVHDDGSIYHQVPYDGLVDFDDDVDVGVAISASFNACRDRVIEILMQARNYEKQKAKNTVSVPKGGGSQSSLR